MGRTGKMFAAEHWNVEPDIICLAKGIASGMPLGAIIARAEVMDWPSGSHASTFGGNPVSCRAALATIDLLEREYMANATARGEQLKKGLVQLSRRFPQLGDVRGLGLMVAVDVVKDGNPALLDCELRNALVQAAFHQGLLLLGCGEAAIRFCPPLCVTAAQVDTAPGDSGAGVAARTCRDLGRGALRKPDALAREAARFICALTDATVWVSGWHALRYSEGRGYRARASHALRSTSGRATQRFDQLICARVLSEGGRRFHVCPR